MVHRVQRGASVTDVETVIDIVHHDVSAYESFDTITTFFVEDGEDGRDAGDGANFSVERHGIWYDVVVRSAATCAECGQPRNAHYGTESEFVLRKEVHEATAAEAVGLTDEELLAEQKALLEDEG